LLNTKTGTIAYANAGHNPPLLVKADGKTEAMRVRGLVLGVLPEIDPEIGRTRLNPGDGVVFYTDGVTEVFNRQGHIFGEKRLKRILRKNWSKAPETLVADIRQATNDFSASIVPYDDFTLLILRRSNHDA
jgi:sigma-B regulation protein RsbU (phosphoserine phosphatase)